MQGRGFECSDTCSFESGRRGLGWWGMGVAVPALKHRDVESKLIEWA